jgi:hypothetical protein
VLPVRVPSICLVSLLLSLALSDDAFDPSFTSVDELLRRPQLEKADFLQLKWKEEIKDKVILPLDYNRYRCVWIDACQAAGLREDPRLYTLRVGAGSSMDSKLASSLSLSYHLGKSI